MSRYRNRNIRSKFRDISPKQTADSGFGEVAKGYVNNPEFSGVTPSDRLGFSSDGSSDIEIIDDERSVDAKSSGSSISWSEDYGLYQAQATQLVAKEYEKMERVLKCLEPIPGNYDRDEYKLWIKTFPCLSLTESSGTSAKSKNIQSSEKSAKKHQPRKSCDKSTSLVKKEIQNRTVIEKLLDELYPQSTTTYTNSKELALNTTLNPRTLKVQFDSFLQITPVPLPKKQPSWLSDFNIPIKKTEKNRKEDFIVLPPIENFLGRSISAATRRANSNISSRLKVPQIPDNHELVDEFHNLNYNKSSRRKNRDNERGAVEAKKCILHHKKINDK